MLGKSNRDCGTAHLRRPRRRSMRGSGARLPVFDVCARLGACAAVPASLMLFAFAPKAGAQDLRFLGKGVEVSGGTYHQRTEYDDGRVESDRWDAGIYRFTPLGALVVGIAPRPADVAGDCRVNGTPTPVGIVFSTKGTHSGQYTCDPFREGTQSEWKESRTSRDFQSKVSVAGNTVTFEATYRTFRNFRNYFATTGRTLGHQATMTGRFRYVLRIQGRTCRVVEHSERWSAEVNLQQADHHERMRMSTVFAAEPPPNCKFLD